MPDRHRLESYHPLVRLERLAAAHGPSIRALREDGAEWIAAALRQQAAGIALRFAVIDGHGVAGICGFPIIDREAGCAQLGYWIGEPFRRRGLATAAASLVAAFGLDSLGMERLSAYVDADNRASRRVLERNGFLLLEEVCTMLVYERCRPRGA